MRAGKRIVFLSLAVGLLLVIAWLMYKALQPPVLPVGSPLPRLTYETCGGIDTMRVDGDRPVMVMTFSTRCAHCMYELDLFEKHYDELTGWDIHLITLEGDFDICRGMLKWLQLASAERVWWGRAERAAFKRAFGVGVSPSLFLFDASGILQSKIRGEVKIEKILASRR